MSDGLTTAQLVADRLRGHLPAPWEVYGERTRRFEVHLSGDRVEMVRGPIEIAGFGLRIFRPAGDRLGIGFASSSDLSDASVALAVKNAEATAPWARSAAARIELPGARSGPGPSVETVDPRLRADPEETLLGLAHELLAGVVARGDVRPSFGSVGGALSEISLVNSEGLAERWDRSSLDLEFAVKAFGGPEGTPPGEYWVTRRYGAVPRAGVREEVADWCRRAADVRRAKPPPPGVENILFPVSVLADVLPTVVGYRLGGHAAVRKIAPPLGTTVASPSVTISDDGLLPLAHASAPFDDEGSVHRRTPLLEAGRVVGTLTDRVHAAALDAPSTGNGHRGSELYRYGCFVAPGVSASTLVVEAGSGGTDAELAEAAGEGVWLDQLGYAFPDPTTSAFGGEIRLGYRIHQGRIGEPVRGGTIGGFTMGPAETPPLLASVAGLGSQAQLVGRLQAPTFLVKGFPLATQS